MKPCPQEASDPERRVNAVNWSHFQVHSYRKLATREDPGSLGQPVSALDLLLPAVQNVSPPYVFISVVLPKGVGNERSGGFPSPTPASATSHALGWEDVYQPFSNYISPD